MDIKRLIYILLGVMLIGFGVGFYSLIYNDDFSLSKVNFGNVNVRSNGSDVKIGSDGIEVKDGDDHVIIDWNGIKVTDGDEEVIVGLDGIKVDGRDYDKDWNLNWNIGNWFGFGPRNLKESNINEEKFEVIDGIESINISSSFVDIKVTSEDRDDVRVKYYGRMKSSVVPTLETEKNGKELIIKLTNPKTNYTVTNSNVVLEIFVPKSLVTDYSISSSSANINAKNIISNDFQTSSSSGDVNLTTIKGENLEFSSSSGEIIGKEIIGDVNASSSSGDIEFTLDESTGDYEISTSSGDVNIYYNNTAGYKGTVNTSSGDLEYNGSINITKEKNHNYEFTLGSGEKNIKINTSSGDIEFENR